MIETVKNVSAETLARHDMIIDVRSPAEFAEDRIPGAVNLPVLSNEERAEVGAIYKQESRFRARRVGAAHVARNVARHLETALAGAPADFRPLLYCWRGGMRSGSMATILSQVGWRTGVVEGGYKTWRREVVAGLRERNEPLRLILLDGQTGTAKSAILKQLAAHGLQTIDLEDLAAHRGSVFGAFPERPQPSQKLFESLLWDRLRALDPARPIIVEAESCRVGDCEIPPRLWSLMLAAPPVVVRAAPQTRAHYLTRAYADIISHKPAVTESINRLSSFHSKKQIEEWRIMADTEQYATLAESLMRLHYDPLYDRSRKRREEKPLAEIELGRLDEAGIEEAAAEIHAIVSRLG